MQLLGVRRKDGPPSPANELCPVLPGRQAASCFLMLLNRKIRAHARSGGAQIAMGKHVSEYAPTYLPATSDPPSALHLLHRAGQRADGLFKRHLSDADLRPRQFAVLRAVAQNDGLSQVDIVDATGIDPAGVTDLVRRLLRAGHLQRRRNRRDVRAYAVKITASGRRLLAIGSPAARAAQDELLASLTANERAVFLAMLARIALEA